VAELQADLTFALLCLKNWRNFGMSTLSGRSRASESNSSAESSQIFCSAPNAPYTVSQSHHNPLSHLLAGLHSQLNNHLITHYSFNINISQNMYTTSMPMVLRINFQRK